MKPTVLELRRRKGARLAMLTAYDFPSARLVAEAGVDLILVGDSLGMVVLGYGSTLPVTMDDMVHHTKATRRGAPEAFVIADLPFLSYGTPELVPSPLARLVTERIAVPTIGIGAGAHCDGQVIVFHDLVGLYSGFTPSFVKRYAEAGAAIRDAVARYAADVRNGSFPAEGQSFGMKDEVLKRVRESR